MINISRRKSNFEESKAMQKEENLKKTKTTKPESMILYQIKIKSYISETITR